MTEISLEEAKAIAERLEKANAESKIILDRAEKLRTLDILGGNTNTTAQVKETTEEEKLKQGAKDFFKGTNIEKALKKYDE